MNISTLSELESLPPGTTLEINNNNNGTTTAVRRDNGIDVRGVVLPTHYFSGLVQGGMVAAEVVEPETPVYEVGSIWTHSNGTLHMLVGVPTDGDGRYWLVIVGLEGHTQVTSAQSSTLAGLTERIAPTANARTRALHGSRPAWEAYVEAQRAPSTPTISAEDRQSIRRAALEEFRQHMVDEWDGESFTGSEVNGLFEHFGLEYLPRPQADVTVDVTVNGTTTIPLDQTEELIQSSRLADADEVEVDWTWNVSWTFTVEADSCACDEVDNDYVRRALDDNGFTYDSFSFESECPNC